MTAIVAAGCSICGRWPAFSTIWKRGIPCDCCQYSMCTVLARSRNLEPVLAMEHKAKVFRPAAWVSAVVLVDGRIKGVWEYEARKQQTVVKVRMFDAPSPKLRKEVEGEAERIGSFLGTGVAVEFLDAP